MRHATPTRSAPAFLVRLPASGQHRRARPARRHLRREPYPTAHLLTRGLAALIVLGIFVMVGVLIAAEDRHTAARTLASAEVDERIATRSVDPAPLSADEVFPRGSATLRVAQASLTDDCPAAATGALRETLARYECSQAVRAALTVPYADHRITAGMMNLPDTTSAMAVGDQLRYLVETDDGGFAEMSGAATGPGTPVVWRTRGHYVMYCVITGPSGELVSADTPQVRQIIADVLDTHLHDTVLVSRAR